MPSAPYLSAYCAGLQVPLRFRVQASPKSLPHFNTLPFNDLGLDLNVVRSKHPADWRSLLLLTADFATR